MLKLKDMTNIWWHI